MFSFWLLHLPSCQLGLQCSQPALLDPIPHPSLTTETHLVRPSDTSDDYATRHNHLPFQKWLNITHLDTFIHGPFKFATVRGHKARDRICQDDWDVLRKSTSMFQNPLPAFDLPTYSIHVDRGAHVTYHNQALTNVLCFEASQTSNTLQDKCYPWQKISGKSSCFPAPPKKNM